MTVIAIGFGRSTGLGGAERGKPTQQVLRTVLRFVAQLAHSGNAPEEGELPAEWFKYPPI